jgi:hypothetical protein
VVEPPPDVDEEDEEVDAGVAAGVFDEPDELEPPESELLEPELPEPEEPEPEPELPEPESPELGLARESVR